jgi:hypothetical protein
MRDEAYFTNPNSSRSQEKKTREREKQGEIEIGENILKSKH